MERDHKSKISLDFIRGQILPRLQKLGELEMESEVKESCQALNVKDGLVVVIHPFFLLIYLFTYL